MNRLHIVFFLLFIAGISSCKKQSSFSSVPEIEFSSYTVTERVDTILQGNKYKVVNLKFKFKDKEGDIGLDKNETSPPYEVTGNYYYNLIIAKFEKQNGQFVYKSNQNSRLPLLTGYATKRGLQGYIDIDLNVLFLVPGTMTLKYEVYIYDRALQKSNTITTPEISL